MAHGSLDGVVGVNTCGSSQLACSQNSLKDRLAFALRQRAWIEQVAKPLELVGSQKDVGPLCARVDHPRWIRFGIERLLLLFRQFDHQLTSSIYLISEASNGQGRYLG